MLNNYRSYLEYKELRRRIEAKLSKPRHVLIHAIVFLATTGFLWLVTFPQIYDAGTAGNPYVPGLLTTVWSFALLVHALWSTFHSGYWPGKREQAVENEMGKLLDEYLATVDDADFFEIHRMLDEDVRQRAGYQFSLNMFGISNAFLWSIWILTGTHGHGYPIWYPVGFTALVFLLCGGILNFWRSGQREQKRMQKNVSKKREQQPVNRARSFATPEHGRLEIMEDDSPVFEKRKR